MSNCTWQDGVLTTVVRSVRRVFKADIHQIDFAVTQKRCRMYITATASGRDGLVVVVGSKVRVRWL